MQGRHPSSCIARRALGVAGFLLVAVGLSSQSTAVADIYPPWWVCIANGGQTRAFYQVVNQQDALDEFHNALDELAQSTGKPAHVDLCQLA